VFVVSEADAAAIRAAWQRDHLAGAVEVLRLFPGITDPDAATECARTIAGWKPLPERVRKVRPRRRIVG
jgi:hypothetical protein